MHVIKDERLPLLSKAVMRLPDTHREQGDSQDEFIYRFETATVVTEGNRTTINVPYRQQYFSVGFDSETGEIVTHNTHEGKTISPEAAAPIAYDALARLLAARER